jgi:AcrR family transcriptional regulator
VGETGKGAATRDAVLDAAVQVAGRIGLSALTIGMLATETGMSKSGLFAHFGSKENLQLQTLARARDEWIDLVVRPALRAPRGEARVRALFEHWVAAGGLDGSPCLFASVPVEFDDQSGIVRDQVIQDHTDFAEVVQQVFSTGISTGEFRADADPVQFQQDLLGIMLACFHCSRLMRDDQAQARTRRAFERLLAEVRNEG